MKFETEHYKYFTYLLNKYLILKEKFKEISNRDYKLNILLNQKYSDIDVDISQLIDLIDNLYDDLDINNLNEKVLSCIDSNIIKLSHLISINYGKGGIRTSLERELDGYADRNLCVSPGLTDISKSGVIPANYSNGTGDVQEIIYATHISGGMDSTLNMPNRIVLDKLSYIDGVLFKYKGIYKLSSDGK